MNKDDLDFYRRLKGFPPIANAFDLLKGIENRKVGLNKQNAAITEDLELFAEEQLVKKEEFDEMRCEMPGQPRSTFLMVFSPDGSRSASTHGNHNIYITDLRSGKHVRTLVGHPRTPWCIAFHPTSNQIVASGCLGGQVRIWDLSGGSEVWTAENQTVIASLAFHPSDRVLVIATYNEVYFWDWSKPEPFAHVATSNAKEKVRYVAFDSLGHKLITGIANSPQTRWERVRAPVPIAHQGYGVSSYRRRITQRLQDPPVQENTNNPPAPRHSLASVPERERRITVCYRNLVREYEQLVHRYLQLYRPPTMIDRGTDPMESSSTSQTIDLTRNPDDSGPSTSGVGGSGSPQTTTDSQTTPQPPSNVSSQENTSTPSTSNSTIKSQSLLTPSKIFSVLSKPSVLIQGTQTESRKHKFEPTGSELPHEKRFKSSGSGTNEEAECSTSGTSSSSVEDQQAGASATPAVGDNSSTSQHQPSGSTSTIERRPVASTSHRTLKMSGTSSAFTEPVKIRTANEKRHRSTDDEESGTRTEGTSQSEVASSTATASESPPSTSTTSTAEQHRGKRFKGFDSTDSQAEVENSSNTSSASETARCSFPGRNQQNYLPATDASSGQNQQRTPSLRVRVALSRERYNLANRNGSGETGRENSQSSGSSTTATASAALGQERGLSNRVGDLLLGIRRTAEEEVRSRILPIIRSVPPNDRPELIRLFENSREHVRMRFRQMYPVFLRKTNRRMLNLADTSSDNSSSDEEPSNSSSSRHVRRNSEPASTPGATANRNNGGSAVPSVSSTNVSNSNPSVSGAGNGATGGVRNFNTELEQLVTSLLNELDRAENDLRTTNGGSTDSNETTQTDNVSGISNDRNSEEPNISESMPALNIPTTSSTPDYSLTRPDDSSIGLLNISTSTSNTSTSQTSGTNSTFTTSSFRTSASSTRTAPNQYSSYAPRRRRLFPCRISAFMPTRVNCFRPPSRLRRPGNLFRARLGASDNIPPSSSSSTFDLDQLINYSERENSEDETTQQPLDLSNHPNPDSPELDNVYSNIRLGNVYSNIIQDLESSLNDVIRMRASNRPGETSDMLGSFSERLESIMNQSDTILRNLSNSMEMLSSATGEAGTPQLNEPRLSFFDPDFYVRDQRSDSNLPEPHRESTINLTDIFSAVAADHTYPRNPDLARSTSRGDGLSPLMTSIHMTISHIQRQARLLRQQVESIERIDRAMLEVAQLQLIRHLNVDLLRYLRTPNGESRSTGMSSVRQMMAGTRISDTSPYESPAEDSARTNQEASQATTSSASSSTSNTGGVSSSGGNGSSWNQPPRSRSSQRKTYPPGRVYRMSRHCRKPPVVHFLSRRYTNRNDRNPRTAPPPRLASRLQQHEPSTSSSRQEPHPNYTYINSYTLSSIARRLENLLMDQMRVFTNLQARPPPSPPTNRSSSMVDLGERILATRLHGCVLRVNRLWDNNQSVRSDSSAAVTQDGESRYGARHTLSTIIESMSRYFEEVGSSNIPQSIKLQIHSVLVMALLLTELLLLVIVDSIPPPSGINLIPERAFLTSRIDHMCNQMLQSRNFYLSHQLTRSLRLVKLTMRHAHRLGQSFHARRNAMLPRNNLERRQLLGSINRCLRTINRRRQPPDQPMETSTPEEPTTSNPEPTEPPEPPTPPGQSSTSAHIREWYSTLIDVLSLYRLNRSNRNSNTAAQNRDSNTALNRSSNTEPPESTASSERVPEQTWTFPADTTREPVDANAPPLRPEEPDEPPTRQNRTSQTTARESARESSVGYPYPYLTWNRERGLRAVLQRNRQYAASTGIAEPGENRRPRFLDDYLNSRVQELNSIHDNTDGDGDDTDDTESYHGNNSPSSQNGGIPRQIPGPPRMMRFLNVPAVQVNDVPVPVSEPLNFSHSHRFITQRQRFADRVSELRANPNMGLFRPRFLHPLYASVNPFDADLDDPQREQIYDSDMITTVTPNHRIQAWDVSDWNVPAISNALKNVVVGECKIHNDASVDIAKDGTILVTLLPSGGYLNVTNRLGVYSLKWETLGQCLYTTSFEQNAVSVSLSPLSRHLVVGLTHRIITSERWVMARVFKIPKDLPGDRLPVLRELEQSRDSRINCIRWLPVSGQGLIYATNTGQLVILS